MRVISAVYQKSLQWNLSYPDLYYPGTSIVQTAQMSHMACSFLTISV